MKLGPFQIVRAAAVKPKPNTRELGASGTVNQSGFIVDDEYNHELVGERGLKVFRRMLRSDGSVREAYMHIVAPILNANWTVEPASDDPEHLEHAEFIRRCYFDWCADSFAQTNSLIMKYLAQGFQVFELPEKVIDAALTYEDPKTGEPVTLAERQFVVWDRWAHRKPETILLWRADNGRLESIQQATFKNESFEFIDIPADQIVVFTNEKEGDDFTGLSLFRAAFKAWVLKEMIEKVMGISIERHGVGINVGYLPESLKNDEAAVARVEEMLGDLTAGERPYLVFPGPKGQASTSAGGGEGGYFFEIVTPTGGLPDFTGALEYLRGEIKGSVLARFSELGHGQTGARSTGDTQSQVWYDALHSTSEYVAGVHRQKIKQLLDKNYAGVDEYPSLVARDIEARTLSEYADALAKLTLAELIRPDRSARAAARKFADMPDEDEGDPVHLAAEQGLKNAALEPLQTDPPSPNGDQPVPEPDPPLVQQP